MLGAHAAPFVALESKLDRWLVQSREVIVDLSVPAPFRSATISLVAIGQSVSGPLAPRSAGWAIKRDQYLAPAGNPGIVETQSQKISDLVLAKLVVFLGN